MCARERERVKEDEWRFESESGEGSRGGERGLLQRGVQVSGEEGRGGEVGVEECGEVCR